MGRGKITMELITNERSRMITYQKRKKGLIKKVEEFHILCGVDTCVIILGPRFNHRTSDTETWPTSRTELRRILNKYRDGKGSDIRLKKIQDLTDYFLSRKKKVDDEISKVRKANKETKFPKWHKQLNSLSFQQLWAFERSLETKLDAAKRRLLEMRSYQYSKQATGISNDGLSLFQNNVAVDGCHYTNYDSFTFDEAIYHHQMLQTSNVSPIMDNPMLMMSMNGEEFVQFGGFAAAAGNPSYDPSAAMLENMMLVNNISGVYPLSCFGPSSPLQKPTVPSYLLQSPLMPNSASQKCITQFGECGDMNNQFDQVNRIKNDRL